MRVVIAEDLVLLREGIASLLTDDGHEVVAAVGDGEALLAALDEHAPDLAIVDVRMPPTQTDEGVRAAVEARRRRPDAAILILSQYVEERYATDLLASGARGIGYLLKDRVADVEEFLAAVRRVAAGGTVIDPEVVAQLLGRRRVDPLSTLTDREREVLSLMAEGNTNGAIVDRLGISHSAVEKHVRKVFGKLGLPETDQHHRRVLAVLDVSGGLMLRPLSAIVCLFLVASGAWTMVNALARTTTEQRATYPGVRTLEVQEAGHVRVTGAPAGSPVRVVARITRDPDGAGAGHRPRRGQARRSTRRCPVVLAQECEIDYDIAVPPERPRRHRLAGRRRGGRRPADRPPAGAPLLRRRRRGRARGRAAARRGQQRGRRAAARDPRRRASRRAPRPATCGPRRRRRSRCCSPAAARATSTSSCPRASTR